MSAVTAISKLQEAVFTALNTDVALGARITAVYDQPDITAVMPYVSMGPTDSVESSTKTEDGLLISFQIFAWSSELSQMESKEIMALIEDALQAADLSIVGYDQVFLGLEKANVLWNIDIATPSYQGLMHYRMQFYKI